MVRRIRERPDDGIGEFPYRGRTARRELAGHARLTPVGDAAHREGHRGQAHRARFHAHHAEGLGPRRWAPRAVPPAASTPRARPRHPAREAHRHTRAAASRAHGLALRAIPATTSPPARAPRAARAAGRARTSSTPPFSSSAAPPSAPVRTGAVAREARRPSRPRRRGARHHLGLGQPVPQVLLAHGPAAHQHGAVTPREREPALLVAVLAHGGEGMRLRNGAGR